MRYARIVKNIPGNYSLPHLEGMYPHQVEILKDYHRFKTIIWHRRARKTTTALEKLLLEAMNPDLPGKVYWHVFPTYGEAKDAIWTDPSMLRRVIPQELIEKTNESELTVYLKSGSIIALKGADKPERLLGAGPYGTILDEFAEMKSEVWTRIIQPIVRASGGWVWFVGTPKGKNHLYDLYKKGLEPSEEWRSFLLKASESGVLPPDQLTEAKENMPLDLYNQEFECEFLAGSGSIFRGVKEVMTAKPQEPISGHLYYIGCDLAKAQDFTVLSVFDRHSNEQVYQDRFNRIEWPFQKAKIREIAKHYNNALIVLDATGLGDVIVDDLLRDGLMVEPVRFTEFTKKELVEKLSIWIQMRKIRLLPIKESFEELESFSYELGPTGRIKYGAPYGKHDDIVISLALGVWLLQPPWVPKKENEQSLLHRNYQRLKMQARLQNEVEWNEWGAY